MADQFVTSASSGSMVTYPPWMQAAAGDAAIVFSGQDLRRLISPGVPGTGVIDGASMVATQRAAGANFSIDISTGTVVVAGTSVADQGKFVCKATGTVNLTTPGAPASGTRNHLVVAEVLDKQASGSSYGWQYHLLEDTGGGLPTAPASSEPICKVTIASGQASVTTANITDLRQCCRHAVGVGLSRSSTHLLTANTRVPVQWNTEDDDTFNLVSLTADNTKINIRHAGLYDLYFLAAFNTTSSGDWLELGWTVNGVSNTPLTFARCTGQFPAGAAQAVLIGEHLAAGVYLQAYMNTGNGALVASSIKGRVYRREWRAT